MRAILGIASTTLGEAIRRKVLLVILLIGLLFLIIAPSLGMLSARSEMTVLKATMLAIIQMTSAVIAVVLTVYMIPNEIERRTIYTILSKPVQRWQFLIGKYLGAVFSLGLMMALMTVVVLAVFLILKQNVDEALSIAKQPILYFIQMSLLAAVAIFFSTFVSPLVNFFLSGGVYLLGTFFAAFLNSIQEGKTTPPAVKMLLSTINLAIPNFAMFNTQNTLTNANQRASKNSSQVIPSAPNSARATGA